MTGREKAINDILVVGVGGQGVLLATDIMAEVFSAAGNDAKKSEVHGMAQRGGSVESHVRRGSQVHSPLIPDGGADALLALEKLEALRYAPMLRDDGLLLANAAEIKPVPVSLGQCEYPSDVLPRLREYTENIVVVEALAMAQELGNVRVVNTIMLGVLASHMDIDPGVWLEVISRRVPAKAREVNRRAFHAGYGLIGETKETADQ